MFWFRKSKPYYEFHAPLPLGECVVRLQNRSATHTREMTTTVTVSESDADHCVFQMRVQRARRGVFDLSVYGVLNREDATTTQVLLATEYTQHLAALWLITALTVFMGVLAVLVLQNVFMLVLPVAVVLALYLIERSNYQQVIEMIEAMLEINSSAKVKNSEVV